MKCSHAGLGILVQKMNSLFHDDIMLAFSSEKTQIVGVGDLRL